MGDCENIISSASNIASPLAKHLSSTPDLKTYPASRLVDLSSL